MQKVIIELKEENLNQMNILTEQAIEYMELYNTYRIERGN